MKKKSAIKLGVVALLAVLVALLALGGLTIGAYTIKPVASSISLGLDLRGGVYAVYIADDTTQEGFDDLLNGTIAVLRNRLSAQGFNEATVAKQGTNRIRVEIPDVDDPERIIDIIGTPAHLEFVDPEGNVVIEGKDVKQASPAMMGTTAVVSFELNDSGKRAFAESTTKFVGQPIVIRLDGEIISSPIVNEPITDGNAVIDGMADATEAADLSMLIMSGALPLDIRLDEQNAISATLGVSALENCLTAGVIGLLLVLLFMLAVYRLPGLMADLALIIYILIVLYALALVPGVQLTLPGIAGILLGIGMAVDANVIIFERFREELRNGADLRLAVKRGFKSALTAVIDSNVTTIIVAVVLVFFGTGPIRGFAITLLISVLASMVTSVFITRFLMTNLVKLSDGQHLPRYTRPFKDKANQSTGRPFTSHTRVFAIISGVIIVAAVAMTALGAGINPGIDFTGGSLLKYEMGQSFDVDDVAGALDELDQSGYQIAKSGADQTGLEVRLVLSEGSSSIPGELEDKLKAQYPEMAYRGISFIGANSGQDLINNALMAMLIAFACILVYIIIRFDFQSGLSAIIALVHDVLVMCAFMAFFGRVFQVNSSFVAAILTIVGYSINNTIVIFDRIRELKNNAGFIGKPRADIVESAVSSTFTRTVNTTLTTLLTLLPVFILAGEIREFTFPLVVGMLAGTYSSVLLSGQTWAMFGDRRAQKQAQDKA